MAIFGKFTSLMLQCSELSISALMHVAYAASILTTAILNDVCEFLSSGSFRHTATSKVVNEAIEGITNIETDQSIALESGVEALLANNSLFTGHEDAPIVLVHGIFGFGKGVSAHPRLFVACWIVLFS
jgi:hypothetical protein